MAAKKPEIHDVLIVGAGPAGCAAAITARKSNASTAIIERATFPRDRHCAGWLGPAAVKLATDLGVTAKAAKAVDFRGMRLHSWDLRNNVEINDKDLAGWFVDRSTFDEALFKAAAKAGAIAKSGVCAAAVTLGEDFVTLQLDDESEIRGRILLIADGAESQTALLAKLMPAGRTPSVPQAVYAEFDVANKDSSLNVAIGASRAGQVATLVRNKGRARLALISRDREQPVENQFAAFCAAAQSTGLIGDASTLSPATGLATAGVALDMEAHVGKRCLLIGDAGGFAAAFSGEGLYPGMRSGCIAAEAAFRALKAKVVQDELARFGPTWRRDLADYLRMPNTDLALLMPLIFTNEQMSRRVARAFLLGHQF